MRSLSEMTGPLMFLTTLPHASEASGASKADEVDCFSLHCQALTGGVGLKFLEGVSPSALQTYAPTDTNQVLVAHRTASGHLVKTRATVLRDLASEFIEGEGQGGPGLVSNVDNSSSSQGPTYEASSQWTFKTSEGRYLGTDGVGKVHIDREAVGPLELWSVILREDGVALQAPLRPGQTERQYLSITWDARRGKAVLRADSDEIGQREIWQCFCQVATRQAILKQAEKEASAQRQHVVDNEDAIRLEEHQSYLFLTLLRYERNAQVMVVAKSIKVGA